MKTHIGSIVVFLSAFCSQLHSIDAKLPLNGWYPCSASTLYTTTDSSSDSDMSSSNMDTSMQDTTKGSPRIDIKQFKPFQVFGQPFSLSSLSHESEMEYVSDNTSLIHEYECGKFQLPKCHEAICKSDETVDVFVKRIAATDEGSTKKALWVLQGGPGASSLAMEPIMEAMFQELNGEVSIYTMDHRGTGRSNRLMCEAAQSTTPGSPDGVAIDLEELPYCIEDVLFQLKNQTEAYSVTSAAWDLVRIFESELSNHDVYIYGVSYGTLLVERFMHIAPKQVKGFILDGIASDSGETLDERMTFTVWDKNAGEVGDQLIKYCTENEFCVNKFTELFGISEEEFKENFHEIFLHLYSDLDVAAQVPGINACADVLSTEGDLPSYVIKVLGLQFIKSYDTRPLVMAFIYRIFRCADEDIIALAHLLKLLDEAALETDIESLFYTSPLLHALIGNTELWATTTPSISQLNEWYDNAVLGNRLSDSIPEYCVYTGSKDAICSEPDIQSQLPSSSQCFTYELDEYFSKTAAIPNGATALLLNGGLDSQTPKKYGEYQSKVLEGPHLLVEFDYASHCTLISTPMESSTSTDSYESCGIKILGSYVRENGRIENVDISCMNQLMPLDFGENATKLAEKAFGTEDLWELGDWLTIFINDTNE